ncbi:MAG: lipopolysaccharide biosynthesis protein, partial [Thermoplasmataceae archaeon]
MFKQLLKEASLYSLGPFLARALSLVTVPIYTRILSPADYGALDILSYTAVLVALFVGAALDQAVARFYLDAVDDVEKKRIASTVLIYYVCAFALLIPLVKPFAHDLAHAWLRGQVNEKTVMLVFIFIWVNGVFYIANNQLKYLFFSKQFAICAIGKSIVGMALSLVFVAYYRLGIFGMFLGQVVVV